MFSDAASKGAARPTYAESMLKGAMTKNGMAREEQTKGAHLLSTGSHTSIWRVRAPLLTVLWANEGTALQGRLLRLSPLKGLAATGAVGQDTMEAVRAAIVSECEGKEPKVPGA